MISVLDRVLPDAQKQIASLPFALLLIDPGMCVAYANPAAEQFFGQSSNRLVGMGLDALVQFDDAAMMDRLGQGDTAFSARDTEATFGGLGHRRVDLAVGPIIDSPGWKMLLMQNNSARDALVADSGGSDEALLRAPEVLAHEIKNPLAGIRGAAQLLARKVDQQDHALTSLITDEVDRIAGLIERMQQLSGKTVAPPVPCNLHEIIRRAIAVLEAGKQENGGELVIKEEFDPSLPPVLGEPDGLVQVLLNLLVNAHEACAGIEKPKISVRTRFSSGLQLRAADSRESVRLSVEVSVTDNGPGVPASLREHLFEPFVTAKKSGHGLGLALVRKLVRDMNGRIGHERDEKRGLTHFRIHLPLAPDQHVDRRHSESAA